MATWEGALGCLPCLPKPHVLPVAMQSQLGQDQQAVRQSSKPEYQEKGSIGLLLPPPPPILGTGCAALRHSSRAKLIPNGEGILSTPSMLQHARLRHRKRLFLRMGGGRLRTEDGCKVENSSSSSFFLPCRGQAPQLPLRLHHTWLSWGSNTSGIFPPTPNIHSRRGDTGQDLSPSVPKLIHCLLFIKCICCPVRC